MNVPTPFQSFLLSLFFELGALFMLWAGADPLDTAVFIFCGMGWSILAVVGWDLDAAY